MKKQLILGISGSLRRASYNTALLRHAEKMLPQGTSFDLADLSTVPLYNEDIIPENLPPGIISFRTSLENADAVLIACPEYNYGITGVLKNALDWAATDTLGNLLPDKPVAIMGASRSIFGTARSQLQLRQVLHATNANVIRKPEVYIRRMQDIISENGVISDERTLKKIQALVEALMAAIPLKQ